MKNRNDWRLNGQEEYLKGKTLSFRKWSPSSLNSTHDHCVFCWEKFSDYEGTLHEGYVTADGKHWICPACFRDFKEVFEWSADEKNEISQQK